MAVEHTSSVLVLLLKVCNLGKALAAHRGLRHEATIEERRARVPLERDIRDRGIMSRGLMYDVTQQRGRSLWVREFQRAAAA